MGEVYKVRVNFNKRGIPTRGPFSTDDYNAAQDELVVDLANLATRWNDEAYPVLNSLPKGTIDTRWVGASNVPDTVASGLDGNNIFVDNNTSATTDDSLFWHCTELRPKTMREALLDIYSRIDSDFENLQNQITDLS